MGFWLEDNQAVWLRVLLENAVPKAPDTQTDWEGRGRFVAEELLSGRGWPQNSGPKVKR